MVDPLNPTTVPWHCGSPLNDEQYRWFCLRAAFDYCKWDTQVDGQPVLCRFPLLLTPETAERLCTLAEALYAEVLASEAELLWRTELHDQLGLPRWLKKVLQPIPQSGPTTELSRALRVDFHWTTEGWRISEINSDVAGGYLEASDVTRLMASCYPGYSPLGDPAGALTKGFLEALGPGQTVGLMHLPGYTEDRQLMLYLSQRLLEVGLLPILGEPTQMSWHDRQILLNAQWHRGPLAGLFRFFPTEWLSLLRRVAKPECFVAGGITPICNPGHAVLTQSKRFPLVWPAMFNPPTLWQQLLPESISPNRQVLQGDPSWVLKPALGHEGIDVGMAGLTEPARWQGIVRQARKNPDQWVAQRRFQMLPLETPEGPLFPCVGIYVVNGQRAGAYGRVKSIPLIDDRSRELIVLVPSPTTEPLDAARGDL